MEIITPKKLSIESLAQTTYSDWNSRQELLKMSSDDAEKEAFEILKKQFQSHLSEVLSDEVQSLLDLQFEKNNSAFSIRASFTFAGITWRIYKDIEQLGFWEFSYEYTSVSCFPDNFQKQLLIEMGKLQAKQSS